MDWNYAFALSEVQKGPLLCLSLCCPSTTLETLNL